MRRVLALARKEVRDALRERSILLALLTQLAVAAFSGFLTVGLVGLYDPESLQGHPPTTVAYVGPGGFDAYLAGADYVFLERLDLGEATRRFHAGQVALVVEETYATAAGARTVTLLLPESEIQTPLVVTGVKALLREYEKDLRFEREARIDQAVVYVRTEAQPNPYYGFVYSVLLPLLVLTPVFLAGAMAGDSMSHELQTHTVALLRSAPLSPGQIVLGKLAAPVLLAPVQVLAWSLLLAANGLPAANLGALLALSFALAVLLGAAGVLLALLVRREGQTQAAYALLVLVGAALSLLLPQEPVNLIARLGAGAAEPASYAWIGFYAAAAVALLGALTALARKRLQP